MKSVFPSLCLAAAFAVGLSAQAPTQTPSQPPSQTPPTQTPSTQSPSSASSMAGQKNNVTFTGCVKEGDQPGTYVLSSIKRDEKAGSTTAGTTGSMASMPDMSGKELRLTGASASADLKAHVGHTVRVSGMLAPQSGSRPTGTTGATAEPGAATAPGASRSASGAGPSLNVSSVTMVSSTCNND